MDIGIAVDNILAFDEANGVFPNLSPISDIILNLYASNQPMGIAALASMLKTNAEKSKLCPKQDSIQRDLLAISLLIDVSLYGKENVWEGTHPVTTFCMDSLRFYPADHPLVASRKYPDYNHSLRWIQ